MADTESPPKVDPPITSSVGNPSQVTLKTAFTVCFAVLAVVVLVVVLVKAQVAVILTGLAALIAVALNHLVAILMKKLHLKRGLSIALVLLTGVVLMAAVALLIIPAAISQGEALVTQGPEILESIRNSRGFHLVDERLHIMQQLQKQGNNSAELASGALPPLLHAVSGIFSLLGAGLTIVFFTVFMLTFGPDMVEKVLSQTLPERRGRYESVLGKIYAATGGYLGGLAFICSVNAVLTTTTLAILGIPFFLPLGLLSGFSSMVPYAGPIIAGGLVTLVSLATGGAWKGLAVFIYFVLYGQLEGNLLGPLVFRRTVHVNPLLTFFAVVFCAELAGVVGAVLAVPLMATSQIIVRELLLIRREKLIEETGTHLPKP